MAEGMTLLQDIPAPDWAGDCVGGTNIFIELTAIGQDKRHLKLYFGPLD